MAVQVEATWIPFTQVGEEKCEAFYFASALPGDRRFCFSGETHTGSVAAEAHREAEGEEMCGRASEAALRVCSGNSGS